MGLRRLKYLASLLSALLLWPKMHKTQDWYLIEYFYMFMIRFVSLTVGLVLYMLSSCNLIKFWYISAFFYWIFIHWNPTSTLIQFLPNMRGTTEVLKNIYPTHQQSKLTPDVWYDMTIYWDSQYNINIKRSLKFFKNSFNP